MKPGRGSRFGVFIILLAVFFTLTGTTPNEPCPVLFGVAPNPTESSKNWDAALVEFEATVGRTADIVHYYKRGQDTAFPTETELLRINEPGVQRTAFFNWKPVGLSWREVADGDADLYLLALADKLAGTLDQPFFLSLSAEMEDEVDSRPGSGQSAADFHDYFRHVAGIFRDATQAVTVMNYTGTYKWASQPWFHELYPGDDVVDWIAYDLYAYDLIRTPDLAALLNQTGPSWPGFYAWAAETFPDKPHMLGEWGVHDPAESPWLNAAFLDSVSKQLPDFPKMRAMVYWNHGSETADGKSLSVGTTAVDSSPQSLAAFKRLAHSDILTAPWRCQVDDVEHRPAT